MKNRKMHKVIVKIISREQISIVKQKLLKIVTILLISMPLHSTAIPKPEVQIEPGIYVLVSLSMNDESLRRYFIDAKSVGGKLVLRGLVGDKGERNRFAETRRKLEKARINVEINPNLFEYLDVKQVPVIAVVDKDRSVKQVRGHITLDKALEIMEVAAPSKLNE